MRIVKLLLFGLLICSSGCGTLMSRMSGEYNSDYKVYPAIRCDYYVFTEAMPELWQISNKVGVVAEGAVWVVDIPFSLVTDTLLLPYDIYKVKTYGK